MCLKCGGNFYDYTQCSSNVYKGNFDPNNPPSTMTPPPSVGNIFVNPETGMGYVFDGITWCAIVGGSGSGTPFTCSMLNTCQINDLGNVNAAPTDGQVLTWNNTTSMWEATTITGGGSAVVSTFTNTLTNGVLIGTHNGDGLTPVNIFSPLTVLDLDGNTLTYTDEAGDEHDFTLPAAKKITSSNSTVSISETTTNGVTTCDLSVNIPTGGANSVFTQVITTGTVIGTHSPDGVAPAVDIFAPTPTFDLTGDIITFNNGNGPDQTFTINHPNNKKITSANSSVVVNETTLPDGTINCDLSVTHPTETLTSVVATTNGFTYTDEDSTPTTINFPAQLTSTQICSIVATTCNSGLILNANGDLQFTDNNSTQNTIALPKNKKITSSNGSATITETVLANGDINCDIVVPPANDVNISTTGGFTFDASTDIVTITETDNEQHTINLASYKKTLTSVDSTVGITETTNADGSRTCDLSVNCCPKNVEIPTAAFADPDNPTANEVQNWLLANGYDSTNVVNAYYPYNGATDDPDYLWNFDGTSTVNSESPSEELQSGCINIQETTCNDVVVDEATPQTIHGAASTFNITLEEDACVDLQFMIDYERINGDPITRTDVQYSLYDNGTLLHTWAQQFPLGTGTSTYNGHQQTNLYGQNLITVQNLAAGAHNFEIRVQHTHENDPESVPPLEYQSCTREMNAHWNYTN